MHFGKIPSLLSGGKSDITLLISLNIVLLVHEILFVNLIMEYTGTLSALKVPFQFNSF